MAAGIVPAPTGVIVPWTTPTILNGALATSSWQGGVLQAVNIVIVLMIWWPFLRIMDKQFYEIERKQH
jgi:PTS system cellobiose-specific IIC component